MELGYSVILLVPDEANRIERHDLASFRDINDMHEFIGRLVCSRRQDPGTVVIGVRGSLEGMHLMRGDEAKS